MKKISAIVLTIVSLVCVALMAYALLANAALTAGLQAAVLPIVGALVTAFAAGKLFAAEVADPVPSAA